MKLQTKKHGINIGTESGFILLEVSNRSTQESTTAIVPEHLAQRFAYALEVGDLFHTTGKLPDMELEVNTSIELEGKKVILYVTRDGDGKGYTFTEEERDLIASAIRSHLRGTPMAA